MPRIIKTSEDLKRYLRPIELGGRECAEYELHGFLSRIAMEALQIRMRKQAQVLTQADRTVGANVDVPNKRLRVDLTAMRETNTVVEQGLFGDAAFQIAVLRTFSSTLGALRRACEDFEQSPASGPVTADTLLTYIDTLTTYHTLGAVKFCLKEERLRQEFLNVIGNQADAVDEAMTPVQTSLFNHLYALQLDLLLVRLSASGPEYDAALDAYRERYGFLEAEDMDYEDRNTPEHVTATIDGLGARFQHDAAQVRRQIEALRRSSEEQRAARAQGRNSVLTALEHRTGDRLRLFNLLQLWDQLAAHEDWNRWEKMRFLRNLNRLCRRLHLNNREAGLADLVGRAA